MLQTTVLKNTGLNLCATKQEQNILSYWSAELEWPTKPTYKEIDQLPNQHIWWSTGTQASRKRPKMRLKRYAVISINDEPFQYQSSLSCMLCEKKGASTYQKRRNKQATSNRTRASVVWRAAYLTENLHTDVCNISVMPSIIHQDLSRD